jgi:hypothetical protein
MKMPKKATRLLWEPIGDELLVYSSSKQEASCLNGLARRVFERCDGQTTLQEVAHELACELGVEEAMQTLELSLIQLQKKSLVQDWAGLPTSRRKVLGHVGQALLALPFITSVAAPSAAAAASINCTAVDSASCAALFSTSPNVVGGRRFSGCAEGCNCPNRCATFYCADPTLAGDCTSDDTSNPNSVANSPYCGALFATGHINFSCAAGRAAAVATFFNQLTLQCSSGLDSGSFNCPAVNVTCPATGSIVSRRMFEYVCCDCSA